MKGAKRGFTLVELIVVIVIAGILATMISSFIARPVQNAALVGSRAALSYAADTALRRMARELATALPNSLRVPGGEGARLEFVPTRDLARYRETPAGPHVNAENRLRFDASDDAFNVYAGNTALASAGNLAAGERLVIYNIPDFEPANGQYQPRIYGDAANERNPGVASRAAGDVGPISLTATGNEFRVDMPAHRFLYRSPRQRIYLATPPVSYYCAAGTLRRVTGYPWQVNQPSFAGQGDVLLDSVESCTFTYQPGNSQRSALVTLEVRLRDNEGQVLHLLRQVHQPNAP
ncbi:type II secretion system protein [Alkalilimnicola sp. S0819]|uniref:type II secretion system protein n=1 Tax=Alkalilimnicola sp. S0819 TaxID=2613922 RepID=UPI00126215E3|nr:type II secretion system protein [Alkalilimnicola sp. S0819]KAB7622631.1 type II secretion system protein [Alkalilimnicola sp. S0819]MPQ17402.1 prepilin-type N-terminal cleavage/methylation domain-containing protein [Alkalilimnicola sp. S0819]